ncbi:MAG: Dabb family protein [Chloroflexi bacterium]|nr:Dabb family protein [Chloroflexota bacterium]
MIKHIVAFRLKGEATEEQVRALMDAFNAMPGRIPEIQNMSLGKNLGFRDQTYQYALVCEFADTDAFWRYINHPVHQEAARNYFLPIVAQRAAIQYEF